MSKIIIKLQVGALIQGIDVTFPDGLCPAKQHNLSEQCLHELVPELQEKLIQTISTFSEYASTKLAADCAVQVELN